VTLSRNAIYNGGPLSVIQRTGCVYDGWEIGLGKGVEGPLEMRQTGTAHKGPHKKQEHERPQALGRKTHSAKLCF
jgi:hypothetical protein